MSYLTVRAATDLCLSTCHVKSSCFYTFFFPHQFYFCLIPVTYSLFSEVYWYYRKSGKHLFPQNTTFNYYGPIDFLSRLNEFLNHLPEVPATQSVLLSRNSCFTEGVWDLALNLVLFAHFTMKSGTRGWQNIYFYSAGLKICFCIQPHPCSTSSYWELSSVWSTFF